AVPRAALGPGARAAQGDPRDLGRLRDRAARPGAPRARGAPRPAPDGARAAACRRSHARRRSAARRAADGRTVAGCLPGARRRARRPVGGGGRALRPGGLKAVGRGTLSSGAAIAVLSIIFFAWGGLTSLNDVLIPHLKAVFEMNYARTMLIQFTFFSTYLVMSIPAGRVVAHLGYKPSMVAGLIVAATGALAFYPAATVPSYPLFLLALFVLASGITLLQVSANPYISLIGEPRGASSRLTLAQAVNSLGHTLSPWLIGPLILSVAVLSGAALAQLSPPQQEAYRIAQAQSVRLPYLGIAEALLALASLVSLMRLPPLTEATDRAALAPVRVRARRDRAARELHPEPRCARDVERDRSRILQLHHVPDALHAQHRGLGSHDRQGVEPARDGDLRRRRDPAAAGLSRRRHRRAARLRAAGALLCVHRLVCALGPGGK